MTESERRHELVYVLVRRTVSDNTTVACGVFYEKDKDEAYAYVEWADEDGYVFEVQVTALFE